MGWFCEVLGVLGFGGLGFRGGVFGDSLVLRSDLHG